jgi:hypothetical protein
MNKLHARDWADEKASEIVKPWVDEDADLVRFDGVSIVTPIAAALRAAVEEERAACAKIAFDAREDEEYGHAAFRCEQIGQAIRQRGEEEGEK